MKYCKKCGNIYGSNLTVCSECAVELDDLNYEWILEIENESFKNFSTELIKEQIKLNNIKSGAKILNVNEKNQVTVLQIPIFRTCFSREEHWIIRTEGKEFSPLSKEQIIQAIRDRKLTGEEDCFHPSVNEWRPIKEFMEFSYLFIDELKTCPHCHARNARSSVVCWKCFKPFIVKDKAVKGNQAKTQPIEDNGRAKDGLSQTKGKKKNFSLIKSFFTVFIILIFIFTAFFLFRNHKSAKEKKNLSIASKGIEIINCSGSWETREYDEYSVKYFVIKGNIRNSSKTEKQIVILKGVLYDTKSSVISEKNYRISKHSPGSTIDLELENSIKSGEEVYFELKFYPNEITGKEIGSWDINIFYVSE